MSSYLRRLKIALFGHKNSNTSLIGQRNLRVLRALRHEHNSTEYSMESTKPDNLLHFQQPTNLDREAVWRAQGLGLDDVTLVFVPLVQFKRKVLPMLLQVLVNLWRQDAKLLVVGGEPDLLPRYKAWTLATGLTSQMQYADKHSDVCRLLYATNAFLLPSLYEVFPLATLEAAATGLPLLTTPLDSVEEYLKDGHDGLLIALALKRTTAALERFLSLTPARRRELGMRVAHDTQKYDEARFLCTWRSFYQGIDRVRL